MGGINNLKYCLTLLTLYRNNIRAGSDLISYTNEYNSLPMPIKTIIKHLWWQGPSSLLNKLIHFILAYLWLLENPLMKTLSFGASYQNLLRFHMCRIGIIFLCWLNGLRTEGQDSCLVMSPWTKHSTVYLTNHFYRKTLGIPEWNSMSSRHSLSLWTTIFKKFNLCTIWSTTCLVIYREFSAAFILDIKRVTRGLPAKMKA